MNTTAKWQLILGLAAMAGTAHPAAANPAADHTFTIHVRNYARVDSKTIAQAEKVASRIFQQAGVVSQWADAPVPGQDSSNAPDQQAVGLSDLRVNILPAAMSDKWNLAAGVTGLTPGEGPNRVLAYIFYNRVEEMQRRHLEAFQRKDAEFPVSAAELLGAAIAHEVGHILLNLAIHSKTGIMRGNWDLGVLQDSIYGCLYFTKDQEKTMQAEVARRARQQESLSAAATPDEHLTLPLR